MIRNLILKLMALVFVMGVTITPAMAGSHELEDDSDYKASKHDKKDRHDKKKHDDEDNNKKTHSERLKFGGHDDK